MTAAARRRLISASITEATTDQDTREALREIAAVLDQAGVTVRDRASESWTRYEYDWDEELLGKRVAGALAHENTSRRDLPDCLGFVLRNRLQTITRRASDAQRLSGLRVAAKAPGSKQQVEMRARIVAARERLAMLHADPKRAHSADVAWLLAEIDRLHSFEEQVGCGLDQPSASGALIDIATAVIELDDARSKSLLRVESPEHCGRGAKEVAC